MLKVFPHSEGVVGGGADDQVSFTSLKCKVQGEKSLTLSFVSLETIFFNSFQSKVERRNVKVLINIFKLKEIRSWITLM